MSVCWPNNLRNLYVCSGESSRGASYSSGTKIPKRSSHQSQHWYQLHCNQVPRRMFGPWICNSLSMPNVGLLGGLVIVYHPKPPKACTNRARNREPNSSMRSLNFGLGSFEKVHMDEGIFGIKTRTLIRHYLRTLDVAVRKPLSMKFVAPVAFRGTAAEGKSE